jgi:hypothetical protein
MRFLKHGAGRWAVPAALAAVLAAGLLISPVIAGQKNITTKKVNKTIQKKTNAVQLNVAGPRSILTTATTLAALDLGPGSYVVSTTFDARADTLAGNIACQLRLVGVGQDASNTFAAANSAESTVAMEVAGRAGTATQAIVTCTATGPAVANHIDIVALKVPKARVISG